MTDIRDACDVAVIGGGAAGIMAATTAAQAGTEVLLIEKNRRLGVKILASGGTRCNVVPALDIATIGRAFGVRGERFLRHALHALGPDKIREMLLAQGVPTVVEAYDKVFPKSGRAADVLAALTRRLDRSGARTLLHAPVLSIERIPAGFRLTTPSRSIDAPCVIVTTGGCSYPKTGTTGDGYDWLSAWGHTIRTPRPALAALTVEPDWTADLAGITVEDVIVRARRPSGKIIAEYRRPLLFTHDGLSGPGPMDISRYVDVGTIEIDWLPDTDEARLAALLAPWGGRTVAAALKDRLPRRLVMAILQRAGVPADRRGAELRRDERRRLMELLRRDRVPVRGTAGFDRAEVTAGGVSLDEVDPKTMRSRLVPDLFIAGEILDLDGPIGGYNFQAAFSTGFVAGRAAAPPRASP